MMLGPSHPYVLLIIETGVFYSPFPNRLQGSGELFAFHVQHESGSLIPKDAEHSIPLKLIGFSGV